MISRVAEHCFWLSRYLERAENIARVLDVNRTLLLDLDVPTEQQWRPLLIISGIHDFTPTADAENVQHHLTWEAKNLSSIICSIAAARENARVIREVISADMWERLNFYHLWIQGETAHALYERDRSEFYQRIKRINQLFHGITDATMSHGEPWEFLQLGKYLERACQTARILDVKYHVLLPGLAQVGTPVDSVHWTAILTSCSGYEQYHKQMPASDVPPSIAVPDFLIFDREFPRSVRRCLAECRVASHAISGRPVGKPGNSVEQGLHDLIGWLDTQDIDGLIRTGLHEALTVVVNRTHDLGHAIHQTYFDVSWQPPVQDDVAEHAMEVGVDRTTARLAADPAR